jgi:tRNA threonylcarbamoyladenosine biosynthesis protein TsaE
MSDAETARQVLAQALARCRRARSGSPGETFDLAVETASLLPHDGALFLIGDLGAGKTLFAKGIGKAFGLDPREVTSPSFVIVAEHAGRTPVFHIDLYRLDDPDEIEETGLAEILAGPGIKIVEWAEKLDLSRYVCHVAVFIDDVGERERVLEIRYGSG